MLRVLSVFLVGFLLIAAVGAAYYLHVGLDKVISTSGEDWGQFGDYFGGTAGALLSFISILLLVYTVSLQSKQLSDARIDALKRDLLAHVTKADEEIMNWLDRRLAVSSMEKETVVFGDIVWGLIKPSYVNQGEFKIALMRLHALTCLYCEALALYRDNFNPYFIYKHHQQKAQTILNFLSQHKGLLEPMAEPSLQFCQIHLDGKNK